MEKSSKERELMLGLIGLINVMISFIIFGIVSSFTQFDSYYKLVNGLFIYFLCSVPLFFILAFIQEGVCK
jgi:hypothetical protein